MHGTRESLALGEHCESVAQVRDVVLGLQFVSVERFVTLTTTTCYTRAEKMPLTSRTCCGSNLATAYAVVLVSTVFKSLWKMLGLLRVLVAKLADCGRESEGETGRAKGQRTRERRTYSGAEKAFILHTNCFAEHFVFE